MDRLALGDDRWRRISGLIIGRPDQRGSAGHDNAIFVEGALRIVRMGRLGGICRRFSAIGTAQLIECWRALGKARG